MASAVAERERDRRAANVEILTGGTHPTDEVHEEVIEVMGEDGIDLEDRTPREITTEELESCTVVATMGCSSLDVSEAESNTEIRDWALDDPAGKEIETVREIREEIEGRVRTLFDELDGGGASDRPKDTSPVEGRDRWN
jgi:protein-tyrosine-phosphatase